MVDMLPWLVWHLLLIYGVDYVGVSNIYPLETLPPYWELGRQMMYEMIGNPETEDILGKLLLFSIDIRARSLRCK